MSALPQKPTLLSTVVMSPLGQKQTSAYIYSMSASPPKADIDRCECHVRFGPINGHRWLTFDSLGGGRTSSPGRPEEDVPCIGLRVALDDEQIS